MDSQLFSLNQGIFISQEVYRMPLSKLDQWFRPDGVHPLFLTFTQRKLEARYASQPDPLFRYRCLAVSLSVNF